MVSFMFKVPFSTITITPRINIIILNTVYRAFKCLQFICGLINYALSGSK